MLQLSSHSPLGRDRDRSEPIQRATVCHSVPRQPVRLHRPVHSVRVHRQDRHVTRRRQIQRRLSALRHRSARSTAKIVVTLVTFFNHNFVNCKATLIWRLKVFEIKYNISLNDVHT